jgi:hypothetical protein
MTLCPGKIHQHLLLLQPLPYLRVQYSRADNAEVKRIEARHDALETLSAHSWTRILTIVKHHSYQPHDTQALTTGPQQV